MFQTFTKTLSLLSKHEKKRGLLVLILVIGMALFETLGVASIMPFLTVLGNPQAVESNQYLNQVYVFFNFADTQQFLIVLGLFSFALVVFSAVFRIITTYVINRFTQMRLHSLSVRLLETYLRQPYSYFIGRNTGDMAKSILSEVNQLIANVIRPAMDVIAYALVTLSLIIFLVINDPKLALTIGSVIGGCYLLIYLLIQKRVKQLGVDRLNANKTRFTAAAEALSGIKDIKLLGREHAYLRRFSPASHTYASSQAKVYTLSIIPRYVLEAVGFGGVILLALILMSRSDDFGSVLPVLGLYAFAGYKLLPAAQHIFAAFTKLRFGAASVDELYNDLHKREELVEIHKTAARRLSLSDSIQLHDLVFQYEGAAKPALNHLNITIKKGAIVGLVGTTGAGKTTFVDVVLGLLQPENGALKVDGQTLDKKRMRQWQQSLGYVPQDIFLVDASITENIALGIPTEKIDQAKVETCARMAQVHDFIENELPDGYETQVGERGVRLSGGQRQRLGIARALYHEPEVLVFDEATSALDNLTEQAVMDAVKQLGRSMTIIIIAHRLSTVRDCDCIFYLDKGSLKAEGSYEELLTNNASFRQLATVNVK